MVGDGEFDWSPDAHHLAVSRFVCGNIDCKPGSVYQFVMLVGLSGGWGRTVFNYDCGIHAGPMWSPDGRRIRCGGDWQPRCTIYGTEGPDRLVGTRGADVICGEDGNDRIDARGGNDVVIGGAGNDTIIGGPGKDSLFGAWSDDRILARDRRQDVVDGGPGKDRLAVDVKLDLVMR